MFASDSLEDYNLINNTALFPKLITFVDPLIPLPDLWLERIAEMDQHTVVLERTI